jgi:Zn-dependent peptidase ImmA (M78 family)/transcriptional regulator with XRE-family HTH domain
MSTPRAFVGARLELVRAFHSLTLKSFSEMVGVAVPTLGHYESGVRVPPEDVVRALAEAMRVKPGFFYDTLPDVWREPECSFRRRMVTPESLKRRARAHGTLIGLVIRELATAGIKTPKYNFPEIDAPTTDGIEDAAERCRERWRLGGGPIEHMGRVAEHNGAVLVRHLAHADQIDAFARRGVFSIIVLNIARPSTSRWIFDVAHEVGHFVLHTGVLTGSRDTEAEANRFASALLLPRRAFSREFVAQPFSWPHAFALKRRWRVSVAAIVRRAHDLGLMDRATYRRSYQHLSAQGWLKAEPHEPEFAGPEWLNSAFDLARTRLAVSAAEISERVQMSREVFEEITGITLEKPRVSFRPRLVGA